MPIYRYCCPQGHEADKLRPMDVATAVCSCGLSAKRSPVNHLTVIGTALIPRDERNYRQSYGEYREAVMEVADHYERVNDSRPPREHIQPLDHYALAKAQAKAKGAMIHD